MTTDATAPAKIAAARDAVERAAADLLDHAEGLAMLAMMSRHRERHPAVEAGIRDCLGSLRNTANDDAYWRMVDAAAAFAGAKEAHVRAVEMPTTILRSLREAVEEVIGPDPRPPQPLSSVEQTTGDRHPGVTPEAVHRQGWRDYLMASTAAARIAR
ncbi:hypothetical protein [Methylobacterium fujisawaense]|uniref:hypothetical protein n=1 Tax=Methylobacterium fujisawaense TaxID=107400 RepID=UPI0036F97959